jgi:hypothetical protein
MARQPPKFNQLCLDLELTLSSQEARWLQKSARHLPIVLTQCFNASRKAGLDNLTVFSEAISREIFEPVDRWDGRG